MVATFPIRVFEDIDPLEIGLVGWWAEGGRQALVSERGYSHKAFL